MTLKLGYNTTDGPVLVDESGYQIGGRSWGVIDTADPLGDAEVAADRVVYADEEAAAGSGHPDVIMALAALATRRERRAAAEALDKDALIDALPPEVVDDLPIGGDGKPAKADLTEVAEDGDAELPAAPKKKTTSSTPRSGN